MKIERLGKYISEISSRNKKLVVTDVFSVTNSQGFVKSTDYFNKEVYSKDISNYKIVSNNQFAYNPSRINVGSIDYLKIQSSVVISSLYVVFKCAEGLNEEFLKVFLKSPVGNTRIRSKTKGAVRDSVSFGSLCEIKIPIPSISDQLHIANFLSKAENLISQRKESIALLDEFLKSTFLEMFGDPVKNIKEWKLKLLSDYGKSRLGKMLDGKQIIGNNLKPYLRNSNVQWFSFKLDDLLEMDFDEKDKLEFSLKYGDILMCEGGEIGRCAIWKNQLQDCYFQKAIHRIRLNNEVVLPEYFVYMFWLYTSNGGLKKYMGAATIPHLTGENLKKLKLPIPPITLQTKFAQIIEKTEALKAQYQSSLHALENLYGSLSQRAFKGELVFHHNTDEHPTELVEKEKTVLISEKPLTTRIEKKEKFEVDVLEKTTKKIIPDLNFVPTYREKNKQSYKIYSAINSLFKTGYFTFEDIKKKLIESGINYNFEIIKDEVFNLLRNKKIRQVFADATFKNLFDITHPDFKKVQDLEEKIHFTIYSDQK